MYEDLFAKRLTQLREAKGVSGREMSLDIGQNSSYINRIENGKAMPSMQGFLYICEYLKVTPEEFFRQDIENPMLLNEVIAELKTLSPSQLNIIRGIIADIKQLHK
ncbi:MAG: helix-turn-helix transcriptional regulator [Clostridiales bacterium]|nr:helix-turn-helix transcriptional regulator [Clostridiales bacterium]